MAKTAGNIYVAVKGDLTPLDRALISAWKTADKRSKQIENTFKNFERKVKRIFKSITSGIGGALAGLSFGALIAETIKLADRYTLLQSRVKLVTTSAQNYAAVQKELFDISQNTRSSYETTVEIFARLARATKNTSVSQADMLKVTDALNKSVTISGATTTEASNALIQLSQGLASNRLGGEELRSVMEQIPYVAQQIAEGLGVDIGKFREMSKDGLLTTEVVVKALLKQAAVIDNEFKRMPVTVSQAWILITNAVGLAISKTNEEIGVTENLAKAMQWLADILTSVTSDMDRYLKITISGLEAIAKIVAAGTAIWLFPIVLTRIHKAAFLANLTIFKLRTGAISLNTSLYKTSVSAALASGALSKMQIAGHALTLAFAGWEIGKLANDNFEEVRIAGLAMVAGLDKLWIDFKFTTLNLWEDIPYAIELALASLPGTVGEIISLIAEQMEGISVTVKNPFGDDFIIGLDAVSNKLKGVADSLRYTENVTEEHAEKTAQLNEEYTKAIDIHNRTVDIIAQQRDWEVKLAEESDNTKDTIINNQGAINSNLVKKLEEQKKLREELSVKIHELSSSDYDHQIFLLNKEYEEKLKAAGNDKALIDELYQWKSLTIAKYEEEKNEKVLEVNQKLYEDLEKYTEDYNEILFDQLDAQYEKFEQTGADSLLLDEWYYGERKKILDKHKTAYEEAYWSMLETSKYAAEESALAWIRGEESKINISKIAADSLTENALRAAKEPLKKGLGMLLGEQLGSWIGLGAGASSTEGKDWKERITSGLGYLAQAGAIVLGGKALGSMLYAGGGWISDHPNGGKINIGSGTRDDVLLGFSAGGNIANIGMGGEYVIPKRQTQKYYPILEQIRADKFAEGGAIKDPMDLAHDINAGGFSTFFTEWASTGNYKQGIKAAIIYYLQTALGMTAGKEWGPKVLGFADGGPVPETYSGESIDTDLVKQVKKWLSDWLGIAEEILDPFGMGVGVSEVVDALNNWVSDVGFAPTTASSLSDLFTGIYDVQVPEWLDRGMITTSIDTLDKLVYPFTRDILTPGKSIDIPKAIEYQFSDALEESVEQGVKGLLGLGDDDDVEDLVEKALDPFDIFQEGTNYVPRTGPALIHRGERVFSAPENEELMNIMRGLSFGGKVTIESKPVIKVYIGNKEIKNFVLDVTDDYDVKKSRRGATGRTRYGSSS